MPNPEISDTILALRCQLGDREAWDLLVQRWHPRLWGFVCRMLSDRQTAEDVLQTVWLRVVRSMGGLREPERLAAWLYRIARFAVADQLRRRYGEPAVVPLEEVPEGDIGPEALEMRESLEAGLDRLPPIDREAVVLHYLHELSIADVADICGVPPGTVKSRLHRARRLLRETLSKGDAHESS